MTKHFGLLFFVWLLLLTAVFIPFAQKTMDNAGRMDRFKTTTTTTVRLQTIPSTVQADYPGGVSCVVDGFVVRTDPEHAKAAGCK